jgi:hypothetical protein
MSTPERHAKKLRDDGAYMTSKNQEEREDGQ